MRASRKGCERSALVGASNASRSLLGWKTDQHCICLLPGTEPPGAPIQSGMLGSAKILFALGNAHADALSAARHPLI
jgi:hypothetical protein